MINPSRNRKPSTGKSKRFKFFQVEDVICAMMIVVVALYVARLFLNLNDITYSTRTIAFEEKGYNLYSEQAFYYSYYDDIVKAPSLGDGLHDLIINKRSEYPDTINTLNRFNIYPELIMGVAYRMIGKAISKDQFDFMILIVQSLVGIQTAAIYVTARLFGRSNMCGLAAAMFVTLNFFEYSRAQTHPMLRENFALPFLWIQMGLMYGCVSIDATLIRLVALTMASTVFLLFWQFSQYPLLLQSVALFLVYCIGRLSSTRATKLFVSHVAAVILASVFMFGNEMLLTSVHLIFGLSAIAVIKGERLITTPTTESSANMFNTGIFSIGLRLCAVFGLTFIFKACFNQIMNIEDDAHVLLLLKAHLFGYEDFTTLQYLCGHAYNPLPGWAISNLLNSLLIPTALAVYICLFLKTFADWKNNDGLNTADAAIPFVFAQSSGLILLGFLMLRMLPFFTPSLAILGSLLFTDNHEMLLPSSWYSRPYATNADNVNIQYKKTDGDKVAPTNSKRKNGCKSEMSASAKVASVVSKKAKGNVSSKSSQTGQLFLYVTVMVKAVMFICIIAFSWSRFSALTNAPRRDAYGAAEGKMLMMEWMDTNIPKDAVITASMDISSHVKLHTGRLITIHPHAEKRNMRDRYTLQYQSYANVPNVDVYNAMKELKSEYLITSGCMASCASGYGYDYIASKSGVKGVGTPNTVYVKRFCSRAINDPKSVLPYFTLIYNTPDKQLALFKLE
eukprot:CFRG0073T1